MSTNNNWEEQLSKLKSNKVKNTLSGLASLQDFKASLSSSSSTADNSTPTKKKQKFFTPGSNSSNNISSNSTGSNSTNNTNTKLGNTNATNTTNTTNKSTVKVKGTGLDALASFKQQLSSQEQQPKKKTGSYGYKFGGSTTSTQTPTNVQLEKLVQFEQQVQSEHLEQEHISQHLNSIKQSSKQIDHELIHTSGSVSNSSRKLVNIKAGNSRLAQLALSQQQQLVSAGINTNTAEVNTNVEQTQAKNSANTNILANKVTNKNVINKNASNKKVANIAYDWTTNPAYKHFEKVTQQLVEFINQNQTATLELSILDAYNLNKNLASISQKLTKHCPQ